ncbi:hypothetical protein [Streptomyces sp. NPDC020571]|uniref:hypothetical protein n=1 Tax=Streptomyces sp. NPDC020571 TaxID=3365079 RepID=UPI0037B571C9
MRERSDGAGEADVGSKGESRRIDLSVPQVAGSALAAVVAAKLASSFGVYGTIAGAGLISVVATCGGSVLQHFFKRTGEQIRVKRTVATVRTGGRTASVPASLTEASATGAAPASASGEFTEGTVYRARTKGWRRPLLAAALVFGVTMAGITVYEVASGQNLSGGHSTTVGSAFTGHDKSAADSGKPGDSDSGDSGGGRDGRDPGGSGDPGDAKDSGSGDDAPSATPSGSPESTGDGTSSDGGSHQEGGTDPSPAPTGDATGDEGAGDAGTPDPDASATTPEPGASSRSGTDAPGQDGPAAP